MESEITRSEAEAILTSMVYGVVPRMGLRHINVGHEEEIKALLKDLDRVKNGDAAFRFIVGRNGSGKSFILQTIRNNAMEKGFVVIDADLSPERRLTGSKKQGLNTYIELLQNCSTLARPSGGALESVLQQWIISLQRDVAAKENLKQNDPQLISKVSARIREDLRSLTEMSHGFAFTLVLDAYWRGMKTRNDNLKDAALRWLRGEFMTRTDARQYFPVDILINDENWYEFLKLFARFTRLARFNGLIIIFDECINLYKIPHKISRQNNYEKILLMYNDCMQGKAKDIGIIMSGTEQFIYDEARGLYSYEALRTRLMKSRCVYKDYVDYRAPVILLKRISSEELLVLLERLCKIHAFYYGYSRELTSDNLKSFLNIANSKLGSDEFLTIREVAKSFLEILNILEQRPNVSFDNILIQQANEMQGPSTDPDAPADDIFSELDDL